MRHAPLFELLDEVLDAVDLPVLAGGGVANARRLAAVLAAGAAGARVGTRFVTAMGSAAHPAYVEPLADARGADTVVTGRFLVDCPLCPSRHRVLRHSLEAAERHGGPTVATLAGPRDTAIAIPPFSGIPPCLRCPVTSPPWRCTRVGG